MKILSAILVLVVAPSLASAQVHRGRGFTNSVNVAVVNATEDGSAIIVHHDRGNTILKHGEREDFALGGRGFGAPFGRASIEVTFCSGDVVESHFTPPAWATDTELLGDDALPQTFPKNITEKELDGQVQAAKRRARGLVGGKRLGEELQNWFDAVRKRSRPGLTTDSCVPAQFLSEPFRVPVYRGGYYRERQAFVLYARGSADKKYKLSRR